MSLDNLSGGARDVANSSARALGAGESFTGAWQQTDHQHLAYNVLTDQAGTLYVDISSV